MHLVERLVSGPRPTYRAQDVVSERLVGVPFLEIAGRLEGHLYDASTGEGTFVLYNVGCLAEHGKVDVLAMGATADAVDDALEVQLPELLSL